MSMSPSVTGASPSGVADGAAIEAGGASAEVPERKRVGEMIFNVMVFVAAVATWGAFTYLVFTDPARIDAVWTWLRGLPLVLQLTFWALGLPFMVALWIWENAWALPVRALLVASIGVWTVFILIPRTSA